MRLKEISKTGVLRRLIKAVPNSTVKLFASEVFLTARAASGLFSRRLDFLIVGAQKAGTTALFEMLTRNRLISLSIKKEVHYFDRHYDRGEGWYLSHFIDRQLPIGEATPAYLFDPLSIQRIRTDFAPLKIIVCIRDPVARAISHYQMEVAAGRETRGPADALLADESNLGKLLLETGDTESRQVAFDKSYKLRGLYSGQIQRLINAFGEEHVYILRSETLMSAPAFELAKVAKWLGSKIGDAINVKLSKKEANMGTAVTIPLFVCKELRSYFAADIPATADLIRRVMVRDPVD